jgi:hypothetical protein
MAKMEKSIDQMTVANLNDYIAIKKRMLAVTQGLLQTKMVKLAKAALNSILSDVDNLDFIPNWIIFVPDVSVYETRGERGLQAEIQAIESDICWYEAKRAEMIARGDRPIVELENNVTLLKANLSQKDYDIGKITDELSKLEKARYAILTDLANCENKLKEMREKDYFITKIYIQEGCDYNKVITTFGTLHFTKLNRNKLSIMLELKDGTIETYFGTFVSVGNDVVEIKIPKNTVSLVMQSALVEE